MSPATYIDVCVCVNDALYVKYDASHFYCSSYTRSDAVSINAAPSLRHKHLRALDPPRFALSRHSHYHARKPAFCLPLLQ